VTKLKDRKQNQGYHTISLGFIGTIFWLIEKSKDNSNIGIFVYFVLFVNSVMIKCEKIDNIQM
jgi:hypothetical protein